jgi:hypothetical protein
LGPAARHLATAGLPGSLQSPEQQFDQATGVVTRVVFASYAEVADAAHEFVGVRTGNNFAGGDGGVEQLLADGHQAVKEVGMQRVEAVGL